MNRKSSTALNVKKCTCKKISKWLRITLSLPAKNAKLFATYFDCRVSSPESKHYLYLFLKKCVQDYLGNKYRKNRSKDKNLFIIEIFIHKKGMKMSTIDKNLWNFGWDDREYLFGYTEGVSLNIRKRHEQLWYIQGRSHTTT